MAEISVIIPVYNAENFLRRCVDSLLAQTFSDFDVILIDDGSTDDSPMICDSCISERIHVIHQQNAGPSKARNVGIQWAFSHSSSKYLAFIDSDDCIHPQYLEHLYQAAEQLGCQAAMCRHRYVYPADNWTAFAEKCSPEPQPILPEDLMIRQSDSFNYTWGKLFAKELFSELRFPENVSFGEDNLIVYQAMFAREHVAFVDEPLYFYFYNAEGITKSPWSTRSLDVFAGIEAQLDFYEKNGYNRAYHKEIELYIQQCAYQIHRIREDKPHIKNNAHYLQDLTQRMQLLLREHNDYRLADNDYWYEALYPCRAYFRSLIHRFKHNITANGLQKTLKKVFKRLGRR